MTKSEQRREYFRERNKASAERFHARYEAKVKEQLKTEIPGFFGCKDCKTCAKITCRHNRNLQAEENAKAG